MIASKIEASVWSEAEPSIKRMARQNDAHDLGAMIFSISRGNAKWAADAVFRWLQKEENSVVSDKVENMIVNTQKLVVQGIHASIQSQSRAKGSRNRASETFVKNVVAACLFTIVKQKEDVCDNEPKRLLGTSVNQMTLARNIIPDLITNDYTMKIQERKIRKDKILVKLEPYVFNFLLDDKYTRLDTKQGLEQVVDPRTDDSESITVHRRIWLNENKAQQHILFQASDYYMTFQHDDSGATSQCDV